MAICQFEELNTDEPGVLIVNYNCTPPLHLPQFLAYVDHVSIWLSAEIIAITLESKNFPLPPDDESLGDIANTGNRDFWLEEDKLTWKGEDGLDRRCKAHPEIIAAVANAQARERMHNYPNG